MSPPPRSLLMLSENGSVDGSHDGMMEASRLDTEMGRSIERWIQMHAAKKDCNERREWSIHLSLLCFAHHLILRSSITDQFPDSFSVFSLFSFWTQTDKEGSGGKTLMSLKQSGLVNALFWTFGRPSMHESIGAPFHRPSTLAWIDSCWFVPLIHSWDDDGTLSSNCNYDRPVVKLFLKPSRLDDVVGCSLIWILIQLSYDHENSRWDISSPDQNGRFYIPFFLSLGLNSSSSIINLLFFSFFLLLSFHSWSD